MADEADEKLLEACADVVINSKDYGNYGSEAGALKALRRRAPGHSADLYRDVLRVLSEVHDRAVSAIDRHRLPRSGKGSRFAKLEDIDLKACLQELDVIEPGFAIRQKERILLRVIYWHYLR